MRSLNISVIFLAILAHSSVDAVLKETNPAVVCKFLNGKGLITGPWKDYGPGGSSAGNFGCHTPYKNVGTGFPLPNNLAYYVDGQPSKAGLLYLVLNVNNRKQAVAAHQALLDAAASLAEKASGKPLPDSIREAITAGKPASLSSAGTRIRVTRFDWPTGKGYDIKVSFE
jgi:hypothetical protein